MAGKRKARWELHSAQIVRRGLKRQPSSMPRRTFTFAARRTNRLPIGCERICGCDMEYFDWLEQEAEDQRREERVERAERFLPQRTSGIKQIVKELNDAFYGPHDFVQTSPCGRGEHHPHGLVGKLWRIKDPDSVRVGHCFLAGRLKAGDLFLCVAHSGDCFQDYMYVEEFSNCLKAKPEWQFGSYGIGDSDEVSIVDGEFETLKTGGRVERETGWR